jgi:hypothetical protein
LTDRLMERSTEAEEDICNSDNPDYPNI